MYRIKKSTKIPGVKHSCHSRMNRKRAACILDGGKTKKRRRNKCPRCTKEIIATHLLRQQDTSACPMTRLPSEMIEHIFDHFVGYPVRIHVHTYFRGILPQSRKFDEHGVVTVSSTDTIFQVRTKISAIANNKPHLPLMYVGEEGRIDRTLPIHSETLTLDCIFETKRKEFHAFYISEGFWPVSDRGATQIIRELGYLPPMFIFFIQTL